MKKIIYTQRVEIIESYNERRDCADQEIAKLIWECGYIPIPVNNCSEKIDIFLREVCPDGIVLTGGNDLARYGGNAPERDETEKCLLEYSIKNDIPVYGFCRGMQVIADHFGARLTRVTGHVAVKHILKSDEIFDGREVNSFHNMAVENAEPPLIVTARSEDGVIEAIRHRDKPIYGTMWHPEREKPYLYEDMQFIRDIFK